MTDVVNLASVKASTVRIETVKIEGSLKAIRDLAGVQGAVSAANTALKRVCREAPDKDWIA